MQTTAGLEVIFTTLCETVVLIVESLNGWSDMRREGKKPTLAMWDATVARHLLLVDNAFARHFAIVATQAVAKAVEDDIFGGDGDDYERARRQNNSSM